MKSKFTYLNCERHKEKHPVQCLFTENKNVVSCTGLSKCGLRLEKKAAK
jgi:DUF438 domain-containing protein